MRASSSIRRRGDHTSKERILIDTDDEDSKHKNKIMIRTWRFLHSYRVYILCAVIFFIVQILLGISFSESKDKR